MIWKGNYFGHKEKNSYAASLDEIKENEYNLNIPRYVNTFEEKDAVDLKAISKELQAIEKEMHATDNEIAGYCKELGIEAPFWYEKQEITTFTRFWL